ncbi:hypothetical protein [Cyclobacterium plantarum]|uniref:hypothetical protein n=1 Tax=Cyclobacterium plantarum TaxID=2716263 RepID=UPI003F6F5750
MAYGAALSFFTEDWVHPADGTSRIVKGFIHPEYWPFAKLTRRGASFLTAPSRFTGL